MFLMLNKLSSENNVLATMILHLNMYLVFFYVDTGQFNLIHKHTLT